MRDSTTDKLVRAYHCIRAGDLATARSVIKEVIQASPTSERAWLMMSLAVEDPRQQADCLERVLRLNPNNPMALARLTAITATILEPADKSSTERRVSPPSQASVLPEPAPQTAPWLYQPTTPGFEPDALRAALAARKTGSLPSALTLNGLNGDVTAPAAASTEPLSNREVPPWLKTRPALPLVPPPTTSLPGPAEPASGPERLLRWLVPSLIGAWAVLILLALVVVFVSLR